jgi:hypothetical protein
MGIPAAARSFTMATVPGTSPTSEAAKWARYARQCSSQCGWVRATSASAVSQSSPESGPWL